MRPPRRCQEEVRMPVNFGGFCEQLNDRIHFTRSGPPGVPFHDPFDVVALQRVIGTNAPHVPMSYQTGYSAPLERRLPAFVASLRAQLQHTMPGASPDEIAAEAAGILEPYIGPVFDIAQGHVRPELRRFQAVISDLSRSFLSDEQRARVQLPLVEKLPPLATFAHKADSGPFTIPSDDMKRDFGITVGVVSLPSSYRDHPIVWPSLGHEVGGHDVLHADPGLLPELAKHVQSAIPDKTLGRLWAYWMDEAASDVYGLLNVGASIAF